MKVFTLTLIASLFLISSIFGLALGSKQFIVEGQQGWNHDEGFSGGYFHTYDEFKIAGSDDIPRKVHVFLPKDYESTNARYPVAFFNDGQSTFFNGGVDKRSLNLARIVSNLYAIDRLKKIIIVAVTPINRSYEYSHTTALNHQGGGIEHYARYLADHTKPFIDRNYRTLPDAGNTLIAGSSRGGLAAFLVAALRPESFGNALIQSGSFWAGLDEPNAQPYPAQLRNSALLTLTAPTLSDPKSKPRLYLDWGLNHQSGFANTFIESRAAARSQELSDILRSDFAYRYSNETENSQNANLKVVIDSQGTHDEDAWARRIGEALTFFYGKNN